MSAIGGDRKKNGRCELTVAKETFMMVLATDFLLPKHSPYTKHFSLQCVIDLRLSYICFMLIFKLNLFLIQLGANGSIWIA